MIISDTTKLIEIYVEADDFMQEFDKYCQAKLLGHRPWRGK